MERIIVTGGSGMVGQFLKEIMPNAIYLSSSDCDLTDWSMVIKYWDNIKPTTVIHLAARVGGIFDNINHPAEFLEQNLLINTNVLKASRLVGVTRFIGVLSTCIYPDKVDKYPMTEDMLHLGPPTETNFSYGYAKRCLAIQIDSYNKEYGTKYQYLTPCNLYGEYDKYGDNSHFVGALIKKIIDCDTIGETTLNLFGTGTPLRQFMYGGDLARMIKYCLDNNILDSFNVAIEKVSSIKEIAEIAILATGSKITEIKFDPTKPDGQYRKDVSIEKMKLIIPMFETISLYDGIHKTYNKIKDKDFILR